MIACAKWLGRTVDTCTRGDVCICKDKPRTQRKIFVLEGLIAREAGKPESACPYKQVAALSFALAAMAFASDTFSSDRRCNCSSDSLALPAKWISPQTPNATRESANIVPHFSVNDSPFGNAKAKITSISKPQITAHPHIWAMPLFPDASFFNLMMLSFISPYRKGSNPRPWIGVLLGLIIGGLLVLIDWFLK